MELKLSMNPDWVSVKGKEAAVKLSSCQLSSVYLCNRLALVQEVDLSENDLTDHSLSALSSLQLCQKLDLRANRLVTLAAFPHLPALKVLDLSENQLAVGSVVKDNLAKANLAKLEKIELGKNPCSNENEIKDVMGNLSLLG
jgi:Leucine-rich repeat (LRR) protein